MIRKLNYKFAPKDDRDFKFKHIMGLESIQPLPDFVDLRGPKMPPIYDQGEEGSCTAHAAAAHKEFLDMAYIPRVAASRQFIYYCERVLEGDPGEDSGASMRDSCEVLLNTGVCKEVLWPYKESNLYHAPNKTCYTDAKLHKIGAYFKIAGSYQMKRCLANGYPYVFGMAVKSGFMGEEIAKTGIMQVPKAFEVDEGGHALLCVGYETTKRRFLVRNSWGTGWGLAGYFWMPDAVMLTESLVSDCYTMRLAKQKGM